MRIFLKSHYLGFAVGIGLLVIAALQFALLHLPVPHLTLLLCVAGLVALVSGVITSARMALTAKSRARWRDAARRLARRHGVALAVVLVACLVGQAATLTQHPLAGWYPDSGEYLSFAWRILANHQFTDTMRTPGYPTFLAFLYGLVGRRPVLPSPPGGFSPAVGHMMDLIVLAQATLMVVAALEIYVLAYLISGRRWLAALIAALVGVNIYALAYERLILTETLCYWLLVTLFLVFVYHLRQSSKATYALLGVLLFATIMVRPGYIFLPLLLMVIEALRRFRGHAFRRNWKGIALTLALAYGLTSGYIVANGVTNGSYGLGRSGEYTILGKVLEVHSLYGMPLEVVSPQYARLNADLKAYAQSGNTFSWAFAREHPQYEGQYTPYSIEVLLTHPIDYFRATLRDAIKCWHTPQHLWAPWQVGDSTRPALAAHAAQWSPYANLGTWTQWLFVLSDASLLTYFALPILLITLGIWAWRRFENSAIVAMLSLLLLTTCNILFLGATDYGVEEFDRLRFPGDWAMILVGVMVLAELLIGAAAYLRKRRTASHLAQMRPNVLSAPQRGNQ